MSEEKKVRHSRDRDRRENHDNDVELRPMEKDGDKLQQVVAYLMEHETMTGAQFADLMEGRELSEASATALTDGYGEEESE